MQNCENLVESSQKKKTLKNERVALKAGVDTAENELYEIRSEVSSAGTSRRSGEEHGVRGAGSGFQTVQTDGSPGHITLSEARSRLYRHRSLQVNSHFAAFFKIYKIYTFLHRSELKILKKIIQNFQKV